MSNLHNKLITELEILNDLGSPDAVAAKLESEGIKGQIRTLLHCPLALYLAKKLDVDYSKGGSVWVNHVNVAVGNIEYAYTPLSFLLKQFVANVDQGLYPNIVFPHCLSGMTSYCYT
jgi:hypothetical protein